MRGITKEWRSSMAETQHEHAYPTTWVSNSLESYLTPSWIPFAPLWLSLRIIFENINIDALKARIWEGNGRQMQSLLERA